MTHTMIEVPAFLVLLIGIVLAAYLIAKLPLSDYTGKKLPLETLQVKMGMASLNGGLFFLLLAFATLFWLTLFSILTGGLIWLIYDIVFTDHITVDAARNEWRFTLTKIVALTGVLGAVIALPFTVLRLVLNRAQVDTARDALFNDKINVAVTDLYAQRQVTKWSDDGVASNGWEDDIIRRSGAIDRLEGLVGVDETLGPRVTILLSAYVQELSATVAPPENTPANLVWRKKNPMLLLGVLSGAEHVQEYHEEKARQIWLDDSPKKRTDVERAVQTIGKLPALRISPATQTSVNLRNTNLQGLELNRLNYENADFRNAHLQKVRLWHAKLHKANFAEANLQGADLNGAQLQGAILFRAKLQCATLNGAQLIAANLDYAQLEGITLRNVNLEGASFRESSLRGSGLYSLVLLKTKMNGCKLQWAELCDSKCEETVLIETKLNGAKLSNIEFDRADLWGAQLPGVIFSEVVLDNLTRLDQANFRGACFQNMSLANSPQIEPHLEVIFADASVTLPEDIAVPAHWAKDRLSHQEFEAAWRAFQRLIGQDPADPE